MMQLPDAFLIVEKGEPYDIDDALPLSQKRILLGRTYHELKADYSFLSHYVSRQHATIDYKDGRYILTDLGSRHGTWINNERLDSAVPHKLQDCDLISLANGEVVLVFTKTASMGGKTWTNPASKFKPLAKPILELDTNRRDVVMDGRILYPTLSGKLYALLKVLYDNANSMVSDDDIKRRIWPERGMDDKGNPQVDDTELYTLIGRLRRSLSPHSDLIRRTRNEGYMLDLPS